MFPTLSRTARAVVFYVMTLGSCIGMAVTIPNGESAAALVMVTPAAAVLLMQLVITRDGWHRGGWTPLGVRRLGTTVWPLALALPLVVLAGSEAVVRLTGLTSWQLPTGLETLDLATGIPILICFVFCEEIGWRGYLGPVLTRSGIRAPHLVTGLLHGVWHLPLVFLATDSYLTVGNRWIIVPVFLAVLTCAGQVYGWLREATGSVWPAVLLHAGFNFWLWVADDTVTTSDPDAVAVLGREAGIATLVVLVAVTLWLSHRRPAALSVPAADTAPVRVATPV